MAGMPNNLESGRRLAHGLLQLYKLASSKECRVVAEHLLCALEQLAKSKPACEPALGQACLWIACGQRGRCNAQAVGAGPNSASHRPTRAATFQNRIPTVSRSSRPGSREPTMPL
jgi:hypothetical protein